MKIYQIIIVFLFAISLSFSEINCKNFYFSFSLPDNIKFSSQDVTNFSTDLSPEIMKYAFTFGNGANLVILASNDALIDREYSANDTLNMLRGAFSDERSANYTILYGDNKSWSYARFTNNGTGGRMISNGTVKTTRGYFVTANGSDDISVILTAPAASYNNYEESIIKFVKSITFTGKKPLRILSNKDNVQPGTGNTNKDNNPVKSGNDNTNTTRPPVNQVPVTPPTPLSNKLYLEAFPQAESAIRSAEMYLYKSGVVILEKINIEDNPSYDFVIDKNRKLFKVTAIFPDKLVEKDEELCWVINKDKINNSDIVILMRGNRTLENSWMIPVEIFKKQATEETDNYRLDFKLKLSSYNILQVYRDVRKVFEPILPDEKSVLPVVTPIIQSPEKK